MKRRCYRRPDRRGRRSFAQIEIRRAPVGVEAVVGEGGGHESESERWGRGGMRRRTQGIYTISRASVSRSARPRHPHSAPRRARCAHVNDRSGPARSHRVLQYFQENTRPVAVSSLELGTSHAVLKYGTPVHPLLEHESPLLERRAITLLNKLANPLHYLNTKSDKTRITNTTARLENRTNGARRNTKNYTGSIEKENGTWGCRQYGLIG